MNVAPTNKTPNSLVGATFMAPRVGGEGYPATSPPTPPHFSHGQIWRRKS